MSNHARIRCKFAKAIPHAFAFTFALGAVTAHAAYFENREESAKTPLHPLVQTQEAGHASLNRPIWNIRFNDDFGPNPNVPLLLAQVGTAVTPLPIPQTPKPAVTPLPIPQTPKPAVTPRTGRKPLSKPRPRE